MTAKHPIKRNAASDGYLYIAVLFTSLIIVATITAAMTLSTATARAEVDWESRKSAIRLAESELHRIAAVTQTSGAWRNGTNDDYSDWITVANLPNQTGSKVRHRFTDGDGDLADDVQDSVELTAHAIVQRAEVAVSVRLEPRGQPSELLNFGVTAGDDIQLENGGTLSVERSIQVGDDCKTNSQGIVSTRRLHCSGVVQTTLRGDLAAADVVLPTHNVVAAYVDAGTQIGIGSLPFAGGRRVLQGIVLSPSANPFGAADANGIYWIDAGGQQLRIANCRFDAILAVRNASTIELSGGITWEYPGDPEVILATNSNVVMTQIQPTLDESVLGVNFNPVNAPYRDTLSDADTIDMYPTQLRGIIYSSRDIRIQPMTDGSTLPIVGSLIANNLIVTGYVSVRSLQEVVTTPPIGLTNSIPMQFVRGTFRRVSP